MPLKAARATSKGILILLVLLAGSLPATAQQTDTISINADAATREFLNRAEDLLVMGQFDRAYRMLSPREVDLAGNPLFDYFLGVAALDSGRTSEAIFSLRRALYVRPDFAGARLELARAYFDSGNNELARPLFAQLLGENPPSAVSEVITRYIDAIDRQPRTPQSRFIPYVDLFAGYDTNANAGNSTMDFLGFTLSPQNVETSSGFSEFGAGFDWYLPRSSQFSWVLNARASHRINPDASFVDATYVSGFGGMTWQSGGWFGRALLDGYWGARDGESNESFTGLSFLLGRRIGEHWDISLDLRGGALRHQESIEVLDVNRVLYSLGASYIFESRARLTLQAIGGNDSEQQSGSPYGNSKSGGRLSLTAPLGRSSLLYASIGSLTSDYDGLFFGVPREDEQLNSIFQIEFRDVWTEGLTMIPRLRYIDNESDVDLYGYDRMEVGLVIRWIWQ